LSGAIVKPDSINLWKLVLSPTGSIKPWFHTEGRLDVVLIIPSSWGCQLGAYHALSSNFSGAVAGEKEDFCKGSLSLPIFYFVIILLIFFNLFLLASFYQKYKKNSSFYSWYFVTLLLVHYVVS
jgi:hypothetical protein